MKVENLTSQHGNSIANQFRISNADGVYFQSYKSIIAFIPADREQAFYKQQLGCLADNNLHACPVAYLDDRYWDYSVTTGKYRNQFLGETKAETQRKINSGEYVLTNLN